MAQQQKVTGSCAGNQSSLLAPTSGGSKPAVTTAPDRLAPSSGLHRHPNKQGIHIWSDTHTDT